MQTNANPGALGGVGGISGAGAEGGQTRADELASVNTRGVENANAQEHRERLRLRALGIARISNNGARACASPPARPPIAYRPARRWARTASTTCWWIAHSEYDPIDWFSATGGAFNPWFSTDLVWDDDLNFEAWPTFKPVIDNGAIKPFLTVGAFPLKEKNQPASQGRWMHGVGAAHNGISVPVRGSRSASPGLASAISRSVETSSLDVAGATFGPWRQLQQYEYSRNLRQKGNTLFRTSAGRYRHRQFWGLASRFRPLNLTAALDAPFRSGAYGAHRRLGKNTAFGRGEILAARRTHQPDRRRNYGYLQADAGHAGQGARDWQVSAAIASWARTPWWMPPPVRFRPRRHQHEGLHAGPAVASTRRPWAALVLGRFDRLLHHESGAPRSVDMIQAGVSIRF